MTTPVFLKNSTLELVLGVDTWTLLSDMVSLTMPDFSRSALDNSKIDNANYSRTYLAGMKDGGSVTAVNLYNNVAQPTRGLRRTPFDSNVVREYRITFDPTIAPPGTVGNRIRLKFQAVCVGLTLGELNPDQLIQDTLTLKISGQPSLVDEAL